MKLFADLFPRLFADLRKQTVQSVHAQTALGNSKDRKRRSFEEVTAQQSGSVKRPDVEKPVIDDDEDDDIVRGVKPNGKKWSIPLVIKKVADSDKRLFWGWASVVAIDGKYVVDKQGDVIPIEGLEEAVIEYGLNSRTGGDMHERRDLMKMVQGLVFTPEMEKINVFAKDDDGRSIYGWLANYYVHDDELWAAIKRGERPELSIGGQAVPIDIEQSPRGRA